MITKSAEYEIIWTWRDNRGGNNYVDLYDATTAERAISKFRSAMGQEYSFKKSDIIIYSVTRRELV